MLKNIINNKNKKIKISLSKQFFKYYSNAIKTKNEDLKKEEEQEQQKQQEKEKEISKVNLLNKIFKRYQTNIILIYKIFLEKWLLKSKILGIRAAARDKKKKRKLKKKNNKLIFQKNFGIADKKTNSNGQFSKSIHEFSYIVSNGAVIKESSSNDVGLVTKESKGSTSSDKVKKVNKLGKKKDLGIIKTNSVNEIATKNKLIKDNKENENINCNEDSEEDSGDSFGLDENNSD